MGGWLCSSGAGGHVGRVNSASVVSPVQAPDAPATLREVAASFTSRGLVPRFRLTPLSPAGTERGLAAAGFQSGRPVVVMTLGLLEVGDLGANPEVLLSSEASEAWEATYKSAYAEAEGRSRLGLALASPAPRRFASLVRGDEAVGIGLGVAAFDTLGIFDVMTVRAHRRRGVANDVVGALLAWGASTGADLAYLQVSSDNEPALSLYRQIGFETAYDYRYASPG